MKNILSLLQTFILPIVIAMVSVWTKEFIDSRKKREASHKTVKKFALLLERLVDLSTKYIDDDQQFKDSSKQLNYVSYEPDNEKKIYKLDDGTMVNKAEYMSFLENYKALCLNSKHDNWKKIINEFEEIKKLDIENAAYKYYKLMEEIKGTDESKIIKNLGNIDAKLHILKKYVD